MADGHIITVIGAKGGVGKSQVAANLAFALTSEARGKVMLLDFDQKASGDQNFLTGIKVKKTLKDLVDFTGNIDQKSIGTFANPHPSNVHYIGLPSDPTITDSLDAEAIGKHLIALKKLYPIIVIDGGSDLGPLASKALEHATLIMTVVTPDLLALNQTKRLASDLTSMMFPKEMIHFVLNQNQKGLPVSAEVVSKTLGKQVLGVINKDDQSCAMALNQKKPAVLVLKNSPFSKGVVELARKLIQRGVLSSLGKLKSQGSVVRKDKLTVKEENAWKALKQRVHTGLLDKLNLKDEKNDKNDPNAKIIRREKTKKAIVEILNNEDTKGVLNSVDDRTRIVKEILDEALGLGPLEDLLADASVSEVMVVGPEKIYYEKSGKIKKSEITFSDNYRVLQVIERIVSKVGRRIDEKTPYVDARLEDGSRVHAIIPPSAIDGCCITIRKFPEERLTYKDLVKFGSLTQNMADFLKIAVEGHKNIIVSGGTGSGKTTLVNILGSFIQSNERIITCEDSAELSFPQDHVVRLETKPPSLEGEGEVDIRCLVKQCLRMRPDRIVVGECRGGETLDMLQAMGTGHDGSLTTVHSNNPKECIGRIETLVQYAGAGLTAKAIREMIASAVHLIIQASRLDDGSRKITYITEIGGMQGEVVTLQDIFKFDAKDIDENGKIIGHHIATGFIPKFIETLERKGWNIPRGIFRNDTPTRRPNNAKPGGAPGNRPGGQPPQRPPGNRPSGNRPPGNRPPGKVPPGKKPVKK